MLEFFRHFFGLCGEHWHPNIFTTLLGGGSVALGARYTINKIKSHFKSSENGQNSDG